MKTKDWTAFIGLSLAWGSSFLWIKIAVQEIGPFALVGWRLLFGIVGLLVVVAIRRPEWPRQRKVWLALLVLGLTNTAIPFVLISWAELYIDSAVASILNSSVPLFTMVIAHLLLTDDRMTRQRVLGLLIGFLGVVVLVWRDLSAGLEFNLLAQGAMILAVLFYAGSSVFARRNTQGLSPTVQALVPLITADIVIWGIAPFAEGPLTLPQISLTWIALLWLGLIGSCIAYLLYFYLLHAVGPTRATMVTYTFPVIGVLLGVIFLKERLDVYLILGAALVVSSLLVVNRKT
ncbi:MAG: DMT family transporter [Chloroflexi bacterium]|nr:DMT family transporter [Chloroflexota bacterium]